MRFSKASYTLGFWLVVVGCSVETEPPPVVGDIGDTSAAELKVACNLARNDILAGASGERRSAIERGFTWYDAQVSYSQTSNYQGYRTDCSGFVGASSLERLAVEDSLTQLTRRFKEIPVRVQVPRRPRGRRALRVG